MINQHYVPRGEYHIRIWKPGAQNMYRLETQLPGEEPVLHREKHRSVADALDWFDDWRERQYVARRDAKSYVARRDAKSYVARRDAKSHEAG